MVLYLKKEISKIFFMFNHFIRIKYNIIYNKFNAKYSKFW